MAGAAKHRDRAFVVAGQIIRARANADPDHRCWRCHHTLATCGPNHDGRNRNGTIATWDCGHLPDGGLAAECSPCNRREGAVDGNAKREPSSGWTRVFF
jgi:hypothetical protein